MRVSLRLGMSDSSQSGFLDILVDLLLGGLHMLSGFLSLFAGSLAQGLSGLFHDFLVLLGVGSAVSLELLLGSRDLLKSSLLLLLNGVFHLGSLSCELFVSLGSLFLLGVADSLSLGDDLSMLLLLLLEDSFSLGSDLLDIGPSSDLLLLELLSDFHLSSKSLEFLHLLLLLQQEGSLLLLSGDSSLGSSELFGLSCLQSLLSGSSDLLSKSGLLLHFLLLLLDLKGMSLAFKLSEVSFLFELLLLSSLLSLEPDGQNLLLVLKSLLGLSLSQLQVASFVLLLSLLSLLLLLVAGSIDFSLPFFLGLLLFSSLPILKQSQLVGSSHLLLSSLNEFSLSLLEFLDFLEFSLGNCSSDINFLLLLFGLLLHGIDCGFLSGFECPFFTLFSSLDLLGLGFGSEGKSLLSLLLGLDISSLLLLG